MNASRLVCLSGVLLVLVAGCKKVDGKKTLAPGEMPPNAVVVRVDDVALTFGEMDKRASNLHTYAIEREGIYYATNMLHEATMSFRRKAINEFVYKTVLLNEAARQGITVGEREHLAELQKLSQALLRNNSTTNDYFNKGPQPPDVMRQDFYDNLVIDKLFNKEVQRKIKLRDDVEVEKGVAAIEEANLMKRVTLEAARKQILDGAPFGDVARTISQDNGTARQGGEMREFAKVGRYEAAFEEAAFSLSPGQVSGIVETKAGYHIIKLLARNPAQAATADAPEVPETVRAAHILIRTQVIDRQKIAQAAYMEKFAEGKLAFYEELKAKAKIENVLFPDMQYKAPGNTK